MTVREWCENSYSFKYTVEYSNTIRDCIEIGVIDQFIMAQSYLCEHSSEIANVRHIPMISNSSLQDIYESTAVKKEGILKRIGQIFTNILKAISRAIHHGSTKLEDIEKDRQWIVDTMAANSMAEMDKTKVCSIIWKYFKNLSFAIQIEEKRLPKWINAFVRIEDVTFPWMNEKTCTSMLSIALGESNDDITIQCNDRNPKCSNPKALLEFAKMIGSFADNGYRTLPNGEIDYTFLTDVCKMIADHPDSFKAESTIVINPSKFATLIDPINKAIETINKFLPHVQEGAGTAKRLNNMLGIKEEQFPWTRVYMILTEFQAGAANLVKYYNELIMFRSHVIYELSPVLKKVIKQTKSGNRNLVPQAT